MLKLEQSEVHTWLRLWSFAGAERWQCSLSDCGISVLPSLPWEMSGVIEAAATGPNIHGSEYLLAWQFFFFLTSFSPLFFWLQARQDAAFSSRSLANRSRWVEASLWNKNSSELSPLLTIKILPKKTTPAVPREEGLYSFSFKAPYFNLDPIVVTSVCLCWSKNDGQEETDRTCRE